MKTDKKRSFRGAVLFTVVSVMSLLIIFLTSTLALATAANNRAHKSYSSSQANYTARAAVDGILAAITHDTNFALSVGSVNASNPSLNVNVQFDSTVSGIGTVSNAVVKYEGSQKFFDSDKKEWIDKDLLAVSADVSYAGETKTVTAHLLKNPPANTNSSGGGGGFVTVGNATIGNHTNSFGGTYLGIGMEKGKRFYDSASTGSTHPILGDVTVDQRLYLNVPDGTPLETLPNGKEGYNVYNDIGKNGSSGSMMPVFSPQNNQTFEAPAVINGNFYIGNNSELIFPTKKSGMTIWGNMTVSNSFKMSSVNVSIEDSYKRLPGEPDDEYNERKKRAVENFNEIPYLYVDGELSLNEGVTLGESTLPLNLFIGRLRQYTDNPSTVYANIFCQDENETSVLTGNGGGTNLYKFSDSVINQTENLPSGVNGNFATKGSLNTKGIVNIEGDLLIEHDLTVESGCKLTVGGDVVVGGTLTCNGEMNVSGYIVADSATGDKITTSASTKKMTADNSRELYERHDDVYPAVLGKNVGIQESDGSIRIADYVWLNKEAITLYSMPDSDGDGIIDDNFWDFGGLLVDSSVVIEEELNSIDETTATRDYTDTTWVNVEDNSVTRNENDTLVAGTYMYNGTKVIDPTSLYTAMHDGTIYPKQAERNIILGLDNSVDKSTTQVVRTVDEIEADYNFSTKAITEIPKDSSDPTKLKTDAKIYTDSDVPAVIKGDCTLSGTFNNKKIVIEADSGETWVKLDSSFHMMNGSKLIYDDTKGAGELKIFVEGQVSMDGSGCEIITKTYEDALFHSTDAYQISIYDNVKKIPGVQELECPRITIYSRKPAEGEAKPKIQINNLGIVTASIEAPYMDFGIQDVAPFTASTIYYNGKDLLDLSDHGNRRVGVIGTLNVGELTSAGNNWDFLYVPKSATSTSLPLTTTGAGDLKFVVTYYEGF